MMKRTVLTVAIVALAMTVATTGFAASRGATFTPLGLFPMCTPETPPEEFCDNFPLTTSVSMSADGSVIAGMHAFFSGIYRWTADTGLMNLGPVNGAPYLSADGNTLASTYYDDTFSWGWSAIWAGGVYPNMTWDRLPLADDFAPCGGSGQSTFGISNSGDIVGGLTWVTTFTGNSCSGARGFISEGGVTTVLDSSLNNNSTRVNALNNDGSVIVGWSQTNQREATKWVDGVQSFLCPNSLGAGGDQFCTEGWDVTPDGSAMLTSMALPTDFNARATLVYQDGSYFQLPFPAGGFDPQWDSFFGRAISDDQSTVVGAFGGGGFFGSPPYPVLYVASLDMTIDLQVMLLGQGLDDLFFWFLSEAAAVSANGQIIAGHGTNPDGWIEAYQVDISRIKVCHKPDGNGNGNDRTIAIGWGSVPDHLAHGDILATCEFAASDAASRFADRRMQISSQSPMHDSRVGSIEQIMQSRERTAGLTYDGPVVTMTPIAGNQPEDQQKADAFTPEQRMESLRNRLGRHVRN